MKLLFGLAVAILVLATTLEVVNAALCEAPWKLIPRNPRKCYWDSYQNEEVTKNYAEAVVACEEMNAELMHKDKIDGDLMGSVSHIGYWLRPSTDSSCYFTRKNDLLLKNIRSCAAERFFVCIKNAVCSCTVKDDPMIIGGDGAITQLIGEGRYHLLEYENQTNVCEFDVKIRASETDSFKLMVEKIEINLSDNTTIYLDMDQYQILPDGNIPYNASFDGIVFQRDAVLDTDGNVTTAGYQLRQTENGSIVFEVEDCYQSLEAFPGGDHFDLTVSLEAVGHSAISGLCGNFDDDPSNDFTTADERDVSDQPDRYIQMSDSYRIQSP